jgi:hypothetical protein
MMQTLARWQHPVGSSEALDVLHWAMHPASHQRIPIVIKIASNLPAFFCIIDFIVAHNCNYWPCYGHINKKTSYLIICIVLNSLSAKSILVGEKLVATYSIST